MLIADHEYVHKIFETMYFNLSIHALSTVLYHSVQQIFLLEVNYVNPCEIW